MYVSQQPKDSNITINNDNSKKILKNNTKVGNRIDMYIHNVVQYEQCKCKQ